MRGVLRSQAKIRHLLGCEQLSHIGPAFLAFRGADPDEAPAVFEHIQAVAMIGGSGRRRFRREVLVKSQRRGTCECLGYRGRACFLRTTTDQEDEK